MGAWGEGAFDNDEASDWAWSFDDITEAAPGLAIIESALRDATADPSAELDADAGSIAVAAAELVAFVAGRPGVESPYNESPRAWVASARPSASPELVALAVTALEQVTGANSELAELWDESGPEWRAAIAELRSRLDASAR